MVSLPPVTDIAPGENKAILTLADGSTVLLNSAAGLYTAGRVGSLKDGIALARETIGSGAALNKLREFVDFTQSQAS